MTYRIYLKDWIKKEDGADFTNARLHLKDADDKHMDASLGFLLAGQQNPNSMHWRTWIYVLKNDVLFLTVNPDGAISKP